MGSTSTVTASPSRRWLLAALDAKAGIDTTDSFHATNVSVSRGTAAG